MSPRAMPGRKNAFCASLPWMTSVGPIMLAEVL
jgi:hypothetical protein